MDNGFVWATLLIALAIGITFAAYNTEDPKWQTAWFTLAVLGALFGFANLFIPKQSEVEAAEKNWLATNAQGSLPVEISCSKDGVTISNRGSESWTSARVLINRRFRYMIPRMDANSELELMPEVFRTRSDQRLNLNLESCWAAGIRATVNEAHVRWQGIPQTDTAGQGSFRANAGPDDSKSEDPKAE